MHDFGESDGWFYLVTEFVDGVNLRQMMQLGRLTPNEAVRLVPQICDALHFAHDHGVVHRDIKPESILVDQAGDVKIADFGLAKLVGDPDSINAHLTQTQQVLGTPHYMAPEQIERPTLVDHRADIFSLGVVFYEMLTGQLPLGRFRPPSEHSESSPGLDPVVMRSLEREPEQRYQSVDALKNDVVDGRTRTAKHTRSKLDRLRERRHRRHGRRDARPHVAVVLLTLGVFAVLLTLVAGDLAWSWASLPLLAAASVSGFRALSSGFTNDQRGLRLAGAAIAAWLPVLLVANVMLAVVLVMIFDAIGIDVTNRLSAWVWTWLGVLDLAVLAWVIRALRRSPRWRR